MRLPGIIVFAIMALYGCASAPAIDAVPFQSTGEIGMRAAAMDDQRQEYTSHYSGKLSAWFSAVPGTLFGRPTLNAVYSKPVILGQSFSTDLGRLESSIRAYAEPLEGFMLSPTIVAEPSTMRLARVGTHFLTDRADGLRLGAALFDEESRDFVLLIYCDRPGVIKGSGRFGSDDIQIDLTIDKPGLTWLRAEKTEAGFRVSKLSGAHHIIFGMLGDAPQ